MSKQKNKEKAKIIKFETDEAKCSCNNECDCGEDCNCTADNKCSENCTCNSENCACGEHCNCGEHCDCDEHCDCEENCECGEDCNCEHSHCDCGCEETNLALQYLNLAKQIQADFENYRKRTEDSVRNARIDGMIDAIKTILPSLDVFEVALTQVTDEKSKQGILMVKSQIEKSIQDLGVTKINAVGEKFNPHLHNAVMTASNPDLEDEVITDEFSAGYTYKGKVIRYSQVRVNKK